MTYCMPILSALSLVALGLGALPLAAQQDVVTPAAVQSNQDAGEPERTSGPAYHVGPGDMLSFSFSNAPDANRRARVDIDGTVYIPPVGGIMVAGQTLSELRQDVPGLFAGRVATNRVNGESLLVSISPSDVLIDMEAWRPVYVTGAVRAPGRQAFEVGLTLRQAIAGAEGIAPPQSTASGGGSSFRLSLDDQPGVIEAELRAALIEMAWQSAVLAEVEAIDTEGMTGLGIDEAIVSAVAGVAQERLDVDMARFSERVAYLERSVALAQERAEALREQEAAMVAIAEDEEAEVSRIQDLVDRRLTPNNQLPGAKRLWLQAVERMRSTRSDRLKAEVEARELQFDLTQAALERKAEAQTRLQEARNDAARLQAQLAALGAQPALPETSADAGSAYSSLRSPTIRVHRLGEAGGQSIRMDLDAYLMPGDVVTVGVP